MRNPRTLAVLSIVTAVLAACTAAPDQRTGALPAPEAAAAAWNEQTPVGRIVRDQPETARIFALVEIDYCCGGDASLGEAAAAKQVNVHRLLDALAAVRGGPVDGATQVLPHATVDDLMTHIIDVYHAPLRRDLPDLEDRIATVVRVHGDGHPELPEVQVTFRALRAGMEQHLQVEEARVFPAIAHLAAGRPVDAMEPMIQALFDDHDEVAAALQTLHRLTNGYAPPTRACALYRGVLRDLDHLERQTMAHVHLENQVLLPRARAMLPR